jgi:NAD(P)-dependent dehydrogenase (short-subunit alcohol dehydrogenase family)
MPHTLIVGGTRGLGRVVARLLSESGHSISAIGRREPQPGDSGMPGVRHWVTDIQDVEARARVLQDALAHGGRLSYVVFCQRYRGKENDWAGELEVSLTATKQMIEFLTDHFAVDGDRAIVMVSSVFGSFVGEGQPLSYHVGKAALEHMSRYYAVNLARRGIRVNSITPFTFLKDESKEFYLNNKPLHDLYCRMVPLGRMGTAEDSAKVVAFLCSPAAGFVTGQNIFVDGGLSAVWPETLLRRVVGI